MNVEIFIEALKAAFENEYVLFGLYVGCVVLLLLRGSREQRHLFVFPVVVLLFTLYNPFLMSPLMDGMGFASRIRRIYWLLPVNLLLAYMGVRLIFLARKRLWRSILAVAVAACIVLGGSSMVNTAMDQTENAYKLPDAIIELASSIERNDKGEAQVAFCEPELLALREYDASIKNTLDRKLMWTWQVDVEDEAQIQRILEGASPGKVIALVLRFGYTSFDMQLFRDALCRTRTGTILLRSDDAVTMALEASGCKQVKRVGEFSIYDTRIDEFQSISEHYAGSTLIFLTRHGQTEGNKKGLFMGGTYDSPLTEEAIYQSITLGQHLHGATGFTFDAAYSSELGRAYETAANILAGMGQEDMEVQRVAGFNDIYWGDIDGKTKKEVQAAYGSTDMVTFTGGYGDEDFVNPAGGETLTDFYQRFDAAMEDLVTDPANDGKSILLVAHSSAAEWAKIKFDKELDGLYHNSISIIRYKDGDWTLLSYDDMSYE